MSITLNAKVYNGAGFNANGQSVFKYTGTDTASGFSYLTAKVNTGTGSTASTARWNLSVPHVAVEASACACPGGIIGTDYVRTEVSISSATSAVDRLDLYERILDLVESAEFKASITGMTQPSPT